eukprot:TRINITY_DN20900_c0_g1_i4.p2 TRINITY_DN20900_c0_g1~~TRINITY_DN20900_c0_g1_i4.p2  ORF type:complete len:134 (+),score=34.27 TRINITY_DN20900_c0_g1_i4:58-459(+)
MCIRDSSETDFKKIAEKTDGYSFADLRALCQEAAMEPIRSLDYSQLATLKKDEAPLCEGKHFEVAIKKVPSSVTKKSMEQFNRWIKDNQKQFLSLIHISEPTRPLYISYAVFCLKKKNTKHTRTPTTATHLRN